MLARFGGCYCVQLRGKPAGYICVPQRSVPIKTCTALCDEWLFPDVDVAQSKRLEKETLEDQGEVVDNEDADYGYGKVGLG